MPMNGMRQHQHQHVRGGEKWRASGAAKHGAPLAKSLQHRHVIIKYPLIKSLNVSQWRLPTVGGRVGFPATPYLP